ncbi:MAG: 3-deoxy-manno-octulosonate cytidylyltransferase [Deltaproteobacteria bacterium]|nr:3-deoxy-manno-octulosonate cytidylyltransferase [Deltaproteobacteria bacterium]
MPPCYGIIPARYDSSRFPGKPLADIRGKPMFWHVYTRAAMTAALVRVVIATDDNRIMDAAHKLNVPAVMTAADHVSGTDRVREAAESIGVEPDAVVVNIQGDEPLLDPKMLEELVAPFSDANVSVSTLTRHISPADAQRPDLVKVVVGQNGNALYFSRSVIPFARDEFPVEYLGHVGLYAFRKSVLDRFVNLAPGRLERIEKLEQLRLLENNIPIRVVETAYESIGVDRPEDISRVIAAMEQEKKNV